jgi:hypothetical protein
MVTQFFENGIFRRKFRVFLGEGVDTFMPTSYSFESFLKIDSSIKSKST